MQGLAFLLQGERLMSSKRTISIKTALNKYKLNSKQVLAVEAIKNNKIIVIRGLAGSAKTFTAVYAALGLLYENKVDRIAITRTLVASEKIGTLPGDLSEKVDPFLYPVIEFFNKLGESGEHTFQKMSEDGQIRRAPLAFLRGQTIENEILIVDESQNLTPQQMLMVLTRVGKNGKIVITGDEGQSDLGLRENNGLEFVAELAKVVDQVVDIELTENMRDPLINEIVEKWQIIKEKMLTENK